MDEQTAAKIAAAKSMDGWKSDPKLRAQTRHILSMPIGDRLRQLEAEANFFSAVKPRK